MFNEYLLNLKPYAITKNEAVKERLQARNMEIYDFTLGDPLEPTPQLIRDALINGIDTISQYPTNIGSKELRNACSDWVKKRLGAKINPDTEVISSNGSKEAVFHVPQLLFNSGSARNTVIVPEPGYPVYKSGTLLAGGTVAEHILSGSNDYIFDPEHVPKDIYKNIAAVWINYPNNPTGASITAAQLEKIYSWALEYDIIVLSDECYIEMYYDGQTPPTSMLRIAEKNNYKNLLCFFSLSKRSGMTGYRSGFVAGQAELIAMYAKYRLNVGLGTPDFVQKAAIAAWSDDQHVRERNRIFAAKRKLVDAFFTANAIKVLPSNTTFYVWGEIPAHYATGQEFVSALMEATGIMLTPGEAFGNSCSKNFRMALVPTAEKISACLQIWQQQIDNGTFKL